MENRELNLEELVSVNGGNNAAAAYLAAIAQERNQSITARDFEMQTLIEQMRKEERRKLNDICNEMLTKGWTPSGGGSGTGSKALQ